MEPIDDLKKIHIAIRKALNALEYPGYIKSVKGEGYAKNDRCHKKSSNVRTMDITSFYPSCKREYIFRFFHYNLNMSEDAAWLITDLASFKGHIPTGSPISGTLAYWSHSGAFDEIDIRAREMGCLFTLYVDDMTFSANRKFSEKLQGVIYHNLKKEGLSLSRKKQKSYGPTKRKEVTGNIIDLDGSVMAPNKLKKKLFAPLKKANGKVSALTLKETESGIGRVNAVRSIEGKDKYPDLYGKLSKRKKALEAEKPN